MNVTNMSVKKTKKKKRKKKKDIFTYDQVLIFVLLSDH